MHTDLKQSGARASRRWVEEAVADLDTAHQAAGRLALLTALAPYQVDEGVVQAFRADCPGDDQLVDALAWASFTAARASMKVCFLLFPRETRLVRRAPGVFHISSIDDHPGRRQSVLNPKAPAGA